MTTMDIEGLRALLQRHGELLVEGRWEEIIESFDPSDGNFPIIVQFFSAHATEYEISDLRLRVESVQRGEGDAIEGVVFALDLESEVHAPARLRMRYALSQGEGPAIRRGGFGFRTGASLAGSEPLPVDDEPRDARSWRGWLDPARAELAARTVDGVSLAELGRAATARLRAIDVAPRLASALTLANMMSTRVERVARAVADPAPLVQLARLHRYHLGAIEHLENHAEPAHACVDFIGANYPTLDDAAVYRRHDGRAYAVCGGQALFNLAVLHLGGASPRDVVHVGLKSPYAIHEQVLWNSSVGPLLLSNGYFEPWSARHFDDMRHVYRLSNCSVYVDERGASNLEPAQAEALAAWLREGFAHFDVSLLSTPRSAPAAELLETRSPEA
ncbi:MAG: hypothetical protein KDK70_34595, partial [Myxococcales bacterium]|nr:hypothetical protein [Myxococcales bacterium]